MLWAEPNRRESECKLIDKNCYVWESKCFFICGQGDKFTGNLDTGMICCPLLKAL